MVSRGFRQAHLQEVGLTQILGDHDFFRCFPSMKHFTIDSKTDKHHQMILSNWWNLRHIILKQTFPSFFRQQNMQWSCNMVYSHFTLSLRTRDYIEWISQHPWYGLWMRVKGPHHYKVTALGSCMKWPLDLYNPHANPTSSLFSSLHLRSMKASKTPKHKWSEELSSKEGERN
jgi:hypothetical protein